MKGDLQSSVDLGLKEISKFNKNSFARKIVEETKTCNNKAYPGIEFVERG